MLKKLLLVYLFFVSAVVSSHVVHAQTPSVGFPDLIIRHDGDSLRCFVVKMNNDYLLVRSPEESEKQIEVPRKEILKIELDHFVDESGSHHQSGVDNTEIRPEIHLRKFIPNRNIFFSLHGGYSHRPGKIRDDTMQDRIGVRSGYSLGSDFFYVTRDGINSVGLSFEYIKHSYRLPVLGAGRNSDYDVNVNTTFIGPAYMGYFPPGKKTRGFLGWGTGAVFYKESMSSWNWSFKETFFGFKWMGGLMIRLNHNVGIELGLSFHTVFTGNRISKDEKITMKFLNLTAGLLLF